MTTTALLLVPLAGLMGSLHCVGMCGPFAAYLGTGSGNRALLTHSAYQLGRLTAYTGLGVLVGLLGHGLFAISGIAHYQKSLMVVLGAVMILNGGLYFFPRARQHLTSKVGRILSLRLRGLMPRNGGPFAAGLLGLFSTLLPCGFLYSFALAAGATGHPISAAAVMVMFWLGTLPALLAVGWLSGKAGRSWAAHMRHLVPVSLIAFGILGISGKWYAMGETLVAYCHG